MSVSGKRYRLHCLSVSEIIPDFACKDILENGNQGTNGVYCITLTGKVCDSAYDILAHSCFSRLEKDLLRKILADQLPCELLIDTSMQVVKIREQNNQLSPMC